jgi:hypothetical protein
LGGPLAGALPALQDGVQACLEELFGGQNAKKIMSTSWAGWETLAGEVMSHQIFEPHDRMQADFLALQKAMLAFLPIAGDNYKDITAGKEAEHLKRLQRDKKMKKGKGEVWGRNDCLAESLLQMLLHHGFLQDVDRDDRNDACHSCRLFLRDNENIPLQHRPQEHEFLQEYIHSEEIVRFFLNFFPDKKQKDIPPAGIDLVVHSVWNSQEAVVPPSSTRLLKTTDDETAMPVVFNLYNTTHGGISGMHFDPLWCC